MEKFFHDSWFFTWELFKFMTFFYTVWAPGFLVSGVMACRYRQGVWKTTVGPRNNESNRSMRAVALGILSSSDRKSSFDTACDLLKHGVTPAYVFVFLIASRNMTIHFWSIFALSLGAEFATGQLIGAMIMIGVVSLCVKFLILEVNETVTEKLKVTPGRELPAFPLLTSVLFSFRGWQSVLRFMGREVVRFAPSLLVGIAIAGLIFASGLRSWWPQFANLYGYATFSSDLTNAFVAPFLSFIMFLSPIGNLPIIHALFKTDTLSYAGIISFCLASSIHPRDVKGYTALFGAKKTLYLSVLLYGAAVAGGLGSTWVYAAFGFRPMLPPVKLINKVGEYLLTFIGS